MFSKQKKVKPQTVYTLSGRAIKSTDGTPFTRSRWARHVVVDLKALAQRRARNKVARSSRRINRVRAK